MISTKVKIDVTGMVELIGKTKTRSVTLKMVRAGARELLSIVRPLTPRRRGGGALRQAQGVKAKTGKKGKTASFAVQGARTGFTKFQKLRGYKTPQKAVPAFYDHLVQGGTKPHRLGKGESVGRLAVGRRRARPATTQTRGGQHPGTAPRPYRKRAYEAAKDRIGAVMTRVGGEELQKQIDKISAAMKKGAK